MGNENERKHDPAENRENRRGGGPDQAKTGGGETNVGLTGSTAGAAGGQSAGSGGAIGGSAEFVSGEQAPQAQTSSGGQTAGQDANQVLVGDQEDSGTFSGQPQSGTSAMAANSSRADLGASGAGAPRKPGDSEEPRIAPGGQSEIGGASGLVSANR